MCIREGTRYKRHNYHEGVCKGCGKQTEAVYQTLSAAEAKSALADLADTDSYGGDF